ncbi:MAG: nuclear transport factor 2 family protein [candidate division Zixibacteria bacterium]|nr:nuclear transport factor 2 family protein [candidate division Zixibacteria bacterium]
MTHDNVETLRQAYGAFATGDIPAVLAVLDPNIEWTEAKGFPYGGTYVGQEAVLSNVFIKLGTEWHGYSAKPAEYIDAGDRVVVLGQYSGSYKATGKNFAADFAHVWTFKNGKAVKFVQYTDTVLVREAL